MKTIISLLVLLSTFALSQDKFNGAKLKVDSTARGITFLSDSAKNQYFKVILKDAGQYGLQDQNGNLYFSISGDLLTQDNLSELLLMRQQWATDKALADLRKKKKESVK